MNKKAPLIFLILSCLVCFFLLNAQSKSKAYSESRLMMNTIITISAYGANAKAFVERGFEVFKKIEDISSFHISSSELNKLNTTKSLSASSPLSELLYLAVSFYNETNGFFDPTFAVIQKAYGFYNNTPRLPSQNELKSLLQRCGLKKALQTPLNQNGVFNLASGSLIDLGGLAGGYAVKKAAEELKKAGCKCFLIDDAGDIWFEGQKPNNAPWRIAVKKPNSDDCLAYIESFKPLAVSTSGDYERFIEVDGKKYGHIMSPFTGCPVNYYSSVTITASSPIIADALSTAVFAMPFDKAESFVKQNNIAALILKKDNSLYLSPAGKPYFKLKQK